MLSRITGLNSFPTDILRLIYTFLPPEDRAFVMSKVSRIWHLISLNEFQKFGTPLVYPCIQNTKIAGLTANLILAVSKTNDLISPIKAHNFICQLGVNPCRKDKPIFTCERTGKLIQTFRHRYEGFSSFFHIYWNPSTMQLSLAKEKDFAYRTVYALRTDVVEMFHSEKMIHKSFSMRSFCGRVIEKKQFWSWNLIEDESKAIPSLMNPIIKNVLTLQLRMYVLYLVHLNMIALSRINCEEAVLNLKCNSCGRILLGNDQLIGVFFLKIKKEVIGDGIPILIWESNDYSTARESRCFAVDLLRWSVYSATTQKLAEKLGCRLIDSIN